MEVKSNIGIISEKLSNILPRESYCLIFSEDDVALSGNFSRYNLRKILEQLDVLEELNRQENINGK